MDAPLSQQEALDRGADLLDEHLELFVAEIVRQYLDRLPGYRDVAQWTVEENTRALLKIASGAMRRGLEPDEQAQDELRQLATEWVKADIEIDAIARSFQVGGYELLVGVRTHASAAGIPPEVVEIAQDLAWKWSMLGAAALADAKRAREVSEARRDAARQNSFLRAVADGTLTIATLRRDAEAFGVDVDATYHPVLAAPCNPSVLDATERALRSSGATSTHRAMLAPDDSGLIGVTSKRPTSVPPGVLVAIGPAARLADAAASFAEAREVLAIAQTNELTGVVDLMDLGPLILLATSGDAARRLEPHHFADLPEGFLEVEHTVLAWLERGQSLEQLAADLHLHRNTVRYRITKFRDVTGLDIRQTRDLVVAWWLLTWREAQRRAQQ